jgi:hypothetical protein
MSLGSTGLSSESERQPVEVQCDPLLQLMSGRPTCAQHCVPTAAQ